MSHRYVPVAPMEPVEQDAAGLRLVCLSWSRTSDHLPDPWHPRQWSQRLVDATQREYGFRPRSAATAALRQLFDFHPVTGGGARQFELEREHSPAPQASFAVLADGGLDGEWTRYLRRWGHHREPRSWRARVRSASRASSLSPFKAPKFAFDNGLCSKLRSSNARWWRASASAACSGVSGTAGAFTGPCSCARPSLRSGRGLCGRRGVPEPASSGRPVARCTPGWGGRERRGAWPGWGGLGERSGRSEVPGCTERAPRVAGRSPVACEAACDTSACWERRGARAS